MKKVWFLAVAIAALTACDNSTADNGISTDLVNNPATASKGGDTKYTELPEMKFEEISQDFGTITQGEKVKKIYKFTNVGKGSLLISSAKGSCGCTVPVWPKHPIAPGESGEIEVSFNSDSKLGRIHKKIHIVANTNPAQNTLAITGDVIGPGEKQ